MTGELSWHDNLIYGLHFRAPDPERGKWRSDLVLDIDHILEWIRGAEGGVMFRVAPATLVFHDVADLRIRIEFGGRGYPETLNELSIARIVEGPAGADRDAAPPRRAWRIELNLPQGGEIAFSASGYSQTLRAAPRVLDEQRLPPDDRPPLPAAEP